MKKIELPEIDDIIITGRIDVSTVGTVAKEINKQLKLINEFKNEVRHNFKGEFDNNLNIYVSSYGGEAYAGLGIHDLISSTGIKTKTIGVGPIMSAGTLVFLAGDVRECYAHTHFMIHELAMFMWDKLENIKDNVAQGEILMKQVEDIVCGKTKINRKEFRSYNKKGKD